MSNTKHHIPRDLSLLQRRRLSWAVAKGSPLVKAAKRAGMTAPLARELAEKAEFSAMLEAYRRMAALEEEERHRRLVDLAVRVLQDALLWGDAGVGLFILKQRGRDRCPAEVLAKGVIKSLERKAAKPAPEREASQAESVRNSGFVPPVLREASCPVDNSINRAAAKMRAEVMKEVEIEAAAEIAVAKKRKSQGRTVPKIEALSSGQVSMLMRHYQSQTGKPPEAEPGQPNAPNPK